MPLLLLVLLCCVGSEVFAADPPCPAFKWDVAKELTLFAGKGTPMAAGNNAASAPTIGTDRLYELALLPQVDVVFVSAPGGKKAADASYAGLATLQLPQSGNYRVSVDGPYWLDLVSGGKPAVTRDFQGQHECGPPHKIVEFDLSGAQRFVLQISGAPVKAVKLTVTRAPDSPPA